MAERGRPRGFDRAEALERAMRLFWAKTYEGASLAELTDAMGINAPSLYAAFGSKEGLFREALAHYSDRAGGGFWKELDEIPDARAAVEHLLLATAAAFSDPADPPGCLIVLGAQHGYDDEDAVHRELRDRRRGNLDQLASRLRRAVAEGELSANFDVEGAAAFYLSVQTGMSVLARDGAGRDMLEAVARGAMLGWGGWAGAKAEA